MKNLWLSFQALDRRKKRVVISMLILVLATWLALCLVLALPAAS
jgi:hypothetical protein